MTTITPGDESQDPTTRNKNLELTPQTEEQLLKIYDDLKNASTTIVPSGKVGDSNTRDLQLKAAKLIKNIASLKSCSTTQASELLFLLHGRGILSKKTPNTIYSEVTDSGSRRKLSLTKGEYLQEYKKIFKTYRLRALASFLQDDITTFLYLNNGEGDLARGFSRWLDEINYNLESQGKIPGNPATRKEIAFAASYNQTNRKLFTDSELVRVKDFLLQDKLKRAEMFSARKAELVLEESRLKIAQELKRIAETEKAENLLGTELAITPEVIEPVSIPEVIKPSFNEEISSEIKQKTMQEQGGRKKAGAGKGKGALKAASAAKSSLFDPPPPPVLPLPQVEQPLPGSADIGQSPDAGVSPASDLTPPPSGEEVP